MILLYLTFLSTLLCLLAYGSVCSALGAGLCFVLMSDSSSYIFILTLTSISASVLMWSYYYIDSEAAYRRFTSLILLFLCSIFTLVFSADLLSLFVAWDLLGFTSFFLVVFYRSRSSLSGGLLTGLTNRFGDVFLLSLFGLIYYSSSSSLTWHYYLILLVSFTNSAQVPFSSWLPAAMSAPTPVSALVHSSTLVTAGVYLLYRFGPRECAALCFVGLLTSLVSGLAASFECDVKKVVALSTLSQLGLIVTSVGIGERSLCFAHLNTHAAFKALLFLAVGTLIHSTYGSQEARAAPFLTSSSAFTFLVLITSCLSMCGIGFLSGWVTKEAILFACYSRFLSLTTLLLLYLGVCLTIIYSLRLLVLCSSVDLFFPANCVTSSGSSLNILPMFWLLLNAICQGYFFNFNCFYRPAILSLSDSVLVWGLFVLSFILTLCLLRLSSSGITPYSYLRDGTSLSSALTFSCSSTVLTEISSFLGGGAGMLPSFITASVGGSGFVYKTSLCLILVFCLT